MYSSFDLFMILYNDYGDLSFFYDVNGVSALAIEEGLKEFIRFLDANREPITTEETF